MKEAFSSQDREAAADLNVVAGFCGSVSCVAAPHALLVMKNHFRFAQIKVVLTHMAASMVQPRMLQQITGLRVYVDWAQAEPEEPALHAALTENADVFLVLSATANFLGKAAHGIADDLLTTAILARDCPLVVAPSMNPRMWANPAVQGSLKLLRAYEVEVCAPAQGRTLQGGPSENGSLADLKTVLNRATELGLRHRRRKKPIAQQT